MKTKFFAIPALDPAAAEEEMNRFCDRHCVCHVERQFVMDGANSYWSICVNWMDVEVAPAAAINNRSPSVDYKEVLSAVDFSLYLELRNLRKQVSEQLNVPPYAVFTNQQLADMVQQRVTNKAGLSKIAGVGKARINNYGDEFLQKLNSLWADNLPGNDTDETGKD